MVHDPAPALRKTEMQQANQFYELGNAIYKDIKTRVSHEATQRAVLKHFVRLAYLRNV